jgi:hypothetical protein
MIDDEERQKKENFIYALDGYRGKFSPEKVVFNANLQEFGQRVAVICGLEANGKISPLDAYNKIKDLWDKLERSKQELLDREE